MTRKEQSLLPQAYTPVVLNKLRKEWAPKELASALDMRARDIEKIGDLTFLELGLIAVEFERNPNELWRQLGYARWTSWMASGTNGSKAKRYAARAAFLALTEINMPLEEGSNLKRGSVELLAKVSRQNRPKLLEAARKLEVDDLRKKIEKEYPEEHIVGIAAMRFRPDKSQRGAIDAAIDAVKLLNPEIITREECLELIASEYLLNHQSEIEVRSARA